MVLKPQDVVVLLKLVASDGAEWTYQSLASELSISQSEVHAAARRAVAARLMSGTVAGSGQPLRPALLEFLIHGVKYAFAPGQGPLTRGVPTAYAADPLRDAGAGSGELPPVWPYAEGKVRGYALSPLYNTVPQAALRDARFYALLALVDAIRIGHARDQARAEQALDARLSGVTAQVRRQSVPGVHEPPGRYDASPAATLHIPRSKLAALCRRYGVRRLSVFGSAGRGELRPESDVDLLVEFKPRSKTTSFDLPAMQSELSALLGDRPVDLATPEILENPFRRRAILADLKTIYAA